MSSYSVSDSCPVSAAGRLKRPLIDASLYLARIWSARSRTESSHSKVPRTTAPPKPSVSVLGLRLGVLHASPVSPCSLPHLTQTRHLPAMLYTTPWPGMRHQPQTGSWVKNLYQRWNLNQQPISCPPSFLSSYSVSNSCFGFSANDSCPVSAVDKLRRPSSGSMRRPLTRSHRLRLGCGGGGNSKCIHALSLFATLHRIEFSRIATECA